LSWLSLIQDFKNEIIVTKGQAQLTVSKRQMKKKRATCFNLNKCFAKQTARKHYHDKLCKGIQTIILKTVNGYRCACQP
jgi:hypothetical protein